MRFLSGNPNAVAGTYLYDEIKEDDVTQNRISKFTERTHTCGELRTTDVGKRVILCGWLEYRRMEKFAVLRDSYGHTQLLTKNEVMIAMILARFSHNSMNDSRTLQHRLPLKIYH